MFQSISYDDWQFISGQPVMTYFLDAVNGSQVSIELYAERKVRIFLINSGAQDKL